MSVAARVRRAASEDLGAVVAAVGDLLAELGSTPPPEDEMFAAARALYEDASNGVLLVAEADDGAGFENGAEGEGGARGEAERGIAGAEIVGVLVASFQVALHVPGRYAVIQDLWVAPAWRSRAIGRDLVTALCALLSEQRMARAEVGLPRESFQNIEATESFYLRNGFSPLGPRMRRTFT
jgi:ribosomal protein S18 acetylase RimI-like enzyme